MNIRKAFERGFATLTCGGAMMLVMVGTLGMCFPQTGLMA
jgi:hypothetical protein